MSTRTHTEAPGLARADRDGPRTNVGGANVGLIDAPGGRQRLDTPALLIELGALRRNIARMAEFARRHAVELRPHVKTHKSVEIARRQVEAGAAGVCCATLGEAEVMAHAGIRGVLITSPIVTHGKIERLVRLARSTGQDGVMAVVDHPRNVAALSAAAARAGHRLDVLVDFAAGYGRTGAATPEAVVELARQIAADAHLKLRGLQAYAGNVQHLPDRPRRREAAAAVRRSVRDVLMAARRADIAFEIVTGAGTGTVDLDAQDAIFTELQPGSYVFMDAEYEQVLADEGRSSPYERALFVQTAVVSTNSLDWVTVDGGTKCFATDAGVPIVARGADPASRYAFSGDEHGKLFLPGERPDLGARIEFVPPHCDPTVNLHDVFHVVEGERLVAIWAIDARGRH